VLSEGTYTDVMQLKQTDRVRNDIIRECHSGLDSGSLRTELLRHLRRVMTIDAAFFATVDPATILFTSVMADSILQEVTPHFLENEFLQDDPNKFTQLARGPHHASSLSGATRGDLGQSSRYENILVPLSLGDELRAALVIDGDCWGVMCLHREHAHASFTPEEITFLAQVSPHMAQGLRVALLARGSGQTTVDEGPGVLVLEDDLTVAAITPSAEYWMTELFGAGWTGTSDLPRALTAVVARLRALEMGKEQTPGLVPRIRLRTQSGEWLTLHASRLSRVHQIAVIIERALPADVVPLIMQGYALSVREREVTRLVLQGLATSAISATLHISQDTVQDHLKSIFDKIGVRSRGEVVAAIFEQHYLPQMRAH
jgi:DNA-binding CsgD family transcriptional regulator